MGIKLSENKSIYIRKRNVSDVNDNSDTLFQENEAFESFLSLQPKTFNQKRHCLLVQKEIDRIQIKADYYIGLDWLGNTGRYVYVEPKLNSKNYENFIHNIDSEENHQEYSEVKLQNKIFELDYLKMLLQITSVTNSQVHTHDLLQIDWNAPKIKIEQNEDQLTPFLVIRFLQLLKSIVRKGLKKDYYKTEENLNSKIKGKILVGEHIKINVFNNRLTSTYCSYQNFGTDHLQNRFLKKVLKFVLSYVENQKTILKSSYEEIRETISYCRPAFELISDNINESELNHIKHNPFYKDYNEALEIGKYLLKRFAYNISETAKKQIDTPPFWIDMPRLFELYVYSKMVQDNRDHIRNIHYQFATYGNSLDILVSTPNAQMVIDAKYKLDYNNSHIHSDIRQVAGYARLKKVRNQLEVIDDSNIDCLIIYPDLENGVENLSLHNIIKNRQEIAPYHKVFKLGVKLPYNQS